MRASGWLRRNWPGVFARYVAPSVSVLLLIFAVLGGYMFRYFDRSIRERAVDSMLNSLSQIRQNNENSIKSMVNVASQVGLSADMSPFTLENHADRAYRLKQRLSMFNVNSGLFDQVVLTYKGDHYFYTARTSCHEELFYNGGLILGQMDAAALRALVDGVEELSCIPVGAVSGVIPATSGKYALFLLPIYQDSLVRCGTLIFMISDQTYQSWFAQQVESRINVYIFRQRQIVASHCDFDLPLDAILDAPGNELVYQGHRYLKASLPGLFSNMQYVSVISVDDMLREGRGERRAFWTVLSVLLVLCLVTTGLSAYRLYQPVRRLRSLLHGPSEERDDFDAIESGIRSLIGQNEVLNTRLDSDRSMLQGKLVQDLIKKRVDSRTDFLRAAQEAGLQADFPCYAVALTASDEVTRTVLPPMLPAQGGPVTGVTLELLAQDQILALVFAENSADINSWADALLARLRAGGSKSPVALSGTYTDITRADACYMEAAAAFDARFIMGDQNTLRFELLSGRLEDTGVYPAAQIELLEKAIRSRDEAAVDAALDAVLKRLKSMQLSLYAFRCVYNEILGVLRRAGFSQIQGSDSRVNDVFTLTACQNIDDLDVALRETCYRFLRADNAKQDASRSSSQIGEIAQYMKENFGDDSLSMAVISERFGLSPVRLSLLFKEEMGMSPSDYLSMVRINKACELLRTTDLSIKQVGAQVGYQDVSTFIRRFKAINAMTPLQYRNNTPA